MTTPNLNDLPKFECKASEEFVPFTVNLLTYFCLKILFLWKTLYDTTMVLFVTQEAEVVHLEMNESDVAMVLEKLKDVETHIHKFTNGEQNT